MFPPCSSVSAINNDDRQRKRERENDVERLVLFRRMILLREKKESRWTARELTFEHRTRIFPQPSDQRNIYPYTRRHTCFQQPTFSSLLHRSKDRLTTGPTLRRYPCMTQPVRSSPLYDIPQIRRHNLSFLKWYFRRPRWCEQEVCSKSIRYPPVASSS
jgi:hypothetical protein